MHKGAGPEGPAPCLMSGFRFGCVPMHEGDSRSRQQLKRFIYYNANGVSSIDVSVSPKTARQPVGGG
jgi:hypothetical protein